MNYKKVYDQFIADRMSKPVPNGYTERHHILPRSLGGTDDYTNIIRLLPDEHLFAHILLAKIYGGKMWAAAAWMVFASNGPVEGRAMSLQYGKRVRKWYATTRTALAEESKKRECYFKGQKLSEEHRARMSAAHTGKVKSQQHLANIAAALTGKKWDAERSARASAARKGKKQSPELAAKRGLSNRGKRWVTDYATEFKLDKDASIPEGFFLGRMRGKRYAAWLQRNPAPQPVSPPTAAVGRSNITENAYA